MRLNLIESNVILGDSKFSFLDMLLWVKDELKLVWDRVIVIMECIVFEDKEVFWSLVGMVGYLDSFIENYIVIVVLIILVSKKEDEEEWI